MSRQQQQHKIRLTVLCARSLAKRDLFRLPDPFVRITVDPGGQNGQQAQGHHHPHPLQSHCTDTVKASLDPKWNSHYDLLLRATDAVTISIWNERKVQAQSQKGN